MGYDSAMDRSNKGIMAVAQIILDGVAMNEAALELDWEEARFRCQMIAAGAANAGHRAAGEAAADLSDIFGPAGAEPSEGYGLAMLRLAELIDNIDVGPH